MTSVPFVVTASNEQLDAFIRHLKIRVQYTPNMINGIDYTSILQQILSKLSNLGEPPVSRFKSRLVVKFLPLWSNG